MQLTKIIVAILLIFSLHGCAYEKHDLNTGEYTTVSDAIAALKTAEPDSYCGECINCVIRCCVTSLDIKQGGDSCPPTLSCCLNADKGINPIK